MLAVAACTTLPRLAAPKVTVDRVTIERWSALDAQFSVLVDIANPNDREVAVDAIDAEVRIENVLVGTARLAQPVRLPARGDTKASLVARAALADALQAGAAIARRAEGAGGSAQPIRYAVSGTATMNGGDIIAFSRSGEIRWPVAGAPR